MSQTLPVDFSRRRRAPVAGSPSDDGGDESTDQKPAKAKRHDLEPSMAEVDLKLAKKLDDVLKLGTRRKPKFFTNKPKTHHQTDVTNLSEILTSVKESSVAAENKNSSTTNTSQSDSSHELKPRNLTQTELRDRLIKKYDTLVPELSPGRPTVRVAKVLSASESVEMARGEARKQLEQQVKLSSVGGNQHAYNNGIGSFKFVDGYETNIKTSRHIFAPEKQQQASKKSNMRLSSNGNSSKSVSFAEKLTLVEPSEGHQDSSETDEGDLDEKSSEEEDEDDEDDDTDQSSDTSSTISCEWSPNSAD